NFHLWLPGARLAVFIWTARQSAVGPRHNSDAGAMLPENVSRLRPVCLVAEEPFPGCSLPRDCLLSTPARVCIVWPRRPSALAPTARCRDCCALARRPV